MQSPESLSVSFNCKGVRFDTGNGGLTRVSVQNDAATGELYLHGAHLTAWQPAGHRPILWMSQASYFSPEKPIRGGIPICFPWFGPHQSDGSQPAHGLARITEWSLTSVTAESSGITCLILTALIESYRLEYQVRIGATLSMSLIVTNLQEGNALSEFESALHTYLSVSEIRNVSVYGLESAEFIDKIRGASQCPATGEAIRFTEETDRVYTAFDSECSAVDSGFERKIVIRKTGSGSTVVWNPWIEKSRRMPDFGDNEWTGMLCIESGNIGGERIQLNRGNTHTMTTEIIVENLDAASKYH